MITARISQAPDRIRNVIIGTMAGDSISQGPEVRDAHGFEDRVELGIERTLLLNDGVRGRGKLDAFDERLASSESARSAERAAG